MNYYYYKINNLLDQHGNTDYKELDINRIVPGSQILPYDVFKNNYCILASYEDKQSKGDLVRITSNEYDSLKNSIEENRPQEVNLEQKVKQMEQAIVELTLAMGGTSNV